MNRAESIGEVLHRHGVIPYAELVEDLQEYALSTQSNGWVEIKEGCEMPEDERVLCFSPSYSSDDPMRFRVLDAQFLKIASDVTHWSPLLSPPTKNNP